MIGRWLLGRWLLGRYRRSDTGLGPAVTGLPTGPLRWAAVPAVPAAPSAPVAPSALAESHVRVARPEPAGPPSVPPEVAAVEPARVGPQVVLGFRDGSEAALDPESEQARALEGLARTLTLRD